MTAALITLTLVNPPQSIQVRPELVGTITAEGAGTMLSVSGVNITVSEDPAVVENEIAASLSAAAAAAAAAASAEIAAVAPLPPSYQAVAPRSTRGATA